MTFNMTTNRRALLQTLAAGGAWAALPSIASAQSASDVPLAQLMQPAPLADLWVGSKDAPVTMIEYASMTCPHCAHFDTEVLPAVKPALIEGGKVRLVFRDYPLDALALRVINGIGIRAGRHSLSDHHGKADDAGAGEHNDAAR